MTPREFVNGLIELGNDIQAFQARAARVSKPRAFVMCICNGRCLVVVA